MAMRRHLHQALSSKKQNDEEEDNVWKYEGDVQDGKYHGIGTLSNLVDKSYYQGQWENGVREGFGTQVWPTGEKYQGEWKEGVMDGLGTIVYPNNDTFEGTWEKGIRASGKFVFSDANSHSIIYQEAFIDGAPGPSGTLDLGSKNGKYLGEVSSQVKDRRFSIPSYFVYRHGYGEMAWTDNSKYIGYWKDDKRAGYGIYYEPSGVRYYGSWTKGKKCGYGVSVTMDGLYYAGNFQRGEWRGKGTLGIPNGDTVVGEWNGNKIITATYNKGNFFALPRPVRAIYTSGLERIQKEEDKSLFTSDQKWVGFFQDLLDPANPPLISNVTTHELIEAFKETEIGKSKRIVLHVESIYSVLVQFVEYFDWSYGEERKPQKPQKAESFAKLSGSDGSLNHSSPAISANTVITTNNNFASNTMNVNEPTATTNVDNTTLSPPTQEGNDSADNNDTRPASSPLAGTPGRRRTNGRTLALEKMFDTYDPNAAPPNVPLSAPEFRPLPQVPSRSLPPCPVKRTTSEEGDGVGSDGLSSGDSHSDSKSPHVLPVLRHSDIDEEGSSSSSSEESSESAQNLKSAESSEAVNLDSGADTDNTDSNTTTSTSAIPTPASPTITATHITTSTTTTTTPPTQSTSAGTSPRNLGVNISGSASRSPSTSRSRKASRARPKANTRANQHNKAKKRDFQLLLPLAIEDINSFLFNFTGSLMEVFGMEYKVRKVLYQASADFIFSKIHTTLWPMYEHVYKTKNSLLQAKFTELEAVTPALIGVKSKFQLDSTINQMPELTLEELQNSLRKIQPHKFSEGSGAPPRPANDDATRQPPPQKPLPTLPSPVVDARGRRCTIDYQVTNKEDLPHRSTSHLSLMYGGSSGGEDATGAQRPLVPPKPPNRRARFTTTITAERIAENHNVLSDTEASLSPRATNTSDNEMEDDGGFSILTQRLNKVRRKPQLPYSPVIKALDRLTAEVTPMDKVKCLVSAAQQILECVDRFYTSHEDKKQIVMGAEDKFPVLIYSIIKSGVTNLWCHLHFLQDFVTDFIGDDESKYRTTELGDALKYVMALNWEVRDEVGVLSPVKLIISSCLSTVKALTRVKFNVSAEETSTIVSSVAMCLNKTFRLLSRRVETPYEPFILSDECAHRIKAYPQLKDYYSSVFGVKQLGLIFEEDIVGRRYVVTFKIKHPLYVYAKVAEAILTMDLL